MKPKLPTPDTQGKAPPGPRGRKTVHPEGFAKCSGPCNRVLPADRFFKNKGRGRGISDVCKGCTPRVQLERKIRRDIRKLGAKAYQKRIMQLEDRITLMRRILRQLHPNF